VLQPNTAPGMTVFGDRPRGKRMRAILMVLGLGLTLICAPACQAAAVKPAVDLALVLAVDVSLSIDEGERGLQRVGYIDAWRNKKVADAVKDRSAGSR
jgi:hypothetical protein